MREIVMVNITGKDREGLTAGFTKILSIHNAVILDISQAVIFDHLSLGLLVEIPESSRSSSILKDLLFESHKLGTEISFSAVDPEQYEALNCESEKERLTITLLGRRITAFHVSKVTHALSSHHMNIDNIIRLSDRIPLQSPRSDHMSSIQFSASGKKPVSRDLPGDLMQVAKNSGVDISFQVDDIYRTNRKLVVFDMDSTLIRAEVINELAALAGVADEVSEITRLAMEGKMDFDEGFRQRVALLEGLEQEKIDSLAKKLPLSEGAEKVTRTLKKLGYKIGILSGGFSFAGEYLKDRLNLDYVYANELDMKNGRATGLVKGEIINGARKAALLKQLAEQEGLSLSQTIAVGDGANDLPMISIAGLGVAFNAKPVVREKANSAISSVGLDGLLYLLGIRDRELS
ncbi:MAG: phosphoserine phosphatase SerB [Desulfobacteraceae bacterium]